MLFNSIAYFIFLPLVFIMYWSRRNAWQQNFVLLLASLVFYGWWNMACLGLMVGLCVVNYLSVSHLKGLWARNLTLCLNFSVLFLFKYFDFFSQSFADLLHLFGVCADMPTLRIILPMGISFYIFQLSSYVVDCYSGKLQPCRSPMKFLTFICFFPQLVAGPIERGSNLLPQFYGKRTFDEEEATCGMRLILWGLVKKVLVADNCAVQVDYAFSHYDTLNMPSLWMGALYFTFQIYCDFSGYSDIAVGSAKLFGIRLTRNFNRPYLATSMQDFWRRWHISLMDWFRDYVYIPIGGSRCSAFRKHLKVLLVFFLSGLWHGAGWTYVCWGLYHALVYRVRGFLVFIFVMLGWVIFCASDMGVATCYLRGLFSFDIHGGMCLSRFPLLLIVLLMFTEWLMKEREHPFCFKKEGWQSSQVVRLLCYFVVLMSVVFMGGKPVDFIYFQF